MHHFKVVVAAIIATLFTSMSFADIVATEISTKDFHACLNTALRPEVYVATGNETEPAKDATEVQRAAFYATGHACIKVLKPKKVSSAP